MDKNTERYQSFLQQSLMGIYRMDLEFPIDITLPVEKQIDLMYDYAYLAECNQTFADMYQAASDKEIINTRLIDLHGGRDNPVNRAENKKFILNGYQINNAETVETTPEGKTVWFLNNSMGIIEDGKVLGVWGTQLDITRLKEAERDKTELENQLRQAQKMEALGTLAGGIAHDFNNILGVIIGYTDLIIKKSGQGSNITPYLRQIMKASDRAKEMVYQILHFSRKGKVERNAIFIKDIIQEVQTFLRASIPSTITIHLSIDTNLSPVYADPTQINQIIMNLCTNAIHAMKAKGGKLTLSLEEVSVSKGISELKYLKPGKYQKLEVTDTGVGIKKEILQHIFNPYFTTKEEGEGTGMGLAVVYGTVKNHDGEIEVFSEIGKGTVFKIYLPASEFDDQNQPDNNEDLTMPKGKEKILFVDDEAALAELGEQMLKVLGYDVVSRTSSFEALKAFESNPDKFDLLITDLTMPNLTGLELTEKIHQINPNLPVILCTGFSDRITKQNFQEYGINALVMKPMLVKELAKTIREVIS